MRCHEEGGIIVQSQGESKRIHPLPNITMSRSHDPPPRGDNLLQTCVARLGLWLTLPGVHTGPPTEPGFLRTWTSGGNCWESRNLKSPL